MMGIYHLVVNEIFIFIALAMTWMILKGVEASCALLDSRYPDPNWYREFAILHNQTLQHGEKRIRVWPKVQPMAYYAGKLLHYYWCVVVPLGGLAMFTLFVLQTMPAGWVAYI